MYPLDAMTLALLDDWSTRSALIGRDRYLMHTLDRCLASLVASGHAERIETALGPMWRRVQAKEGNRAA
jgi:hypothetical protein